MLLSCALLLASCAASAVTIVGLLYLWRTHSLATARELDAARAAHRIARRLLIAGFGTLFVTTPALLFSLDTGVPKAQVTFVAVILVAVLVMFAAVLLVVDLRVQDKLRPTPQATAASTAEESITYDLNADDLWRSQLQWHIRSRFGRITLAVNAVLALAVLIGLPLLMRSMHPRIPFVIHLMPSLFAVVLVVGVYAFFGKQIFAATFGRRPGILCQHRIEIRADGLREITHVNDTLWPWSHVRELTETNEFLLLRISAVGMFAIPRSAFVSDDHARRFVSAVRQRLATA